MIYDSLRIFLILKETREIGRRRRGDSNNSKAASMMKERSLWLNRDKRIVGSIPGVHVGDIFFQA